MTGAPSPYSYPQSFTRLAPIWPFVSWAMEPRTVHCTPDVSSAVEKDDQTRPLFQNHFRIQESLCSCTSHHNHFLSLMLEREFSPINFPRKSPAYAPVLSCNKPFSTSPHQDFLTFLSCLLWKAILWMPMWKSVCYIPTSPLHQLHPSVSVSNSLNLSHIQLTFPELWEHLTSKSPSIPQTHLCSAILYVLSITALFPWIPYKLSASPAKEKAL